MKLALVADAVSERYWALLDLGPGTLRRIRAPFADWSVPAAGGNGDAFDLAPHSVALRDVRLRAPVNPGARVFGVGLNYLTHLTRLGRKEAPPHTIAYIKPDSAIVDPERSAGKRFALRALPW